MLVSILELLDVVMLGLDLYILLVDGLLHVEYFVKLV